MMKRIPILLFLLPLLAVECEEDDPVAPIDQLPPETRTGEYTFGCLVNGEAFVPESTRDITAIYQGGVLQMGADAKINNAVEGFSISLRDSLLGTQNYILDSRQKGVEFISSTCRYEYKGLVEGVLTITRFDNIDFIVSGTFKFTTVTQDCDTIRVTDGRFDIPYIP